MRIILRVWWGALVILLFTMGVTNTAYAQTPDNEYFEETRHTIRGEFLTFYRSLPEPFVILGYPLTEAIEDTVTQNLVQYFQYGRLELVPDAPSGSRVKISDLGALLYTPGAALADVPASGPLCRLFPQTGKSVCRAFIQFYDRHSGEQFFGNPISDLEIQDGRFVQYFERARMEWRPEQPAGQRVALTQLGLIYLDMIRGRGVDVNRGNIQQTTVTSIVARAFVAKSLIAANSQQTLYIIAQDPDLNPIPNAMVSVTVTLPDGRQEFYRPPATDASGISIFPFNIGPAVLKEIVQVDVKVTALGLENTTGTWFRIWW